MIPLSQTKNATQRPEATTLARSSSWLTALLLIGAAALVVGAGIWWGLGRPGWPIIEDWPTADERVAGAASSKPRLAEDPGWTAQRRRMVQKQLAARDIRNERVLAAMGRVPRHEFVTGRRRDEAYEDYPLPIGEGQTISQPYIVAFMTQAVDPQPEHRVLEVGTGSGYQAAVLAELTKEVYTIELIPSLAQQATARLEQLGYKNVKVRTGDGYKGWPEAAPFDAIVVTCGADHVPEPLFEQLRPGGVMVIPVGEPWGEQSLQVIKKGPRGERESSDTLPVRFVPLRRPGDTP